MENIKISLVDNDYIVKAETDITLNGNDELFINFFKEVSKNLIPGQTAHLEIDGLEKEHISFEISTSEETHLF